MQLMLHKASYGRHFAEMYSANIFPGLPPDKNKHHTPEQRSLNYTTDSIHMLYSPHSHICSHS